LLLNEFLLCKRIFRYRISPEILDTPSYKWRWRIILEWILEKVWTGFIRLPVVESCKYCSEQLGCMKGVKFLIWVRVSFLKRDSALWGQVFYDLHLFWIWVSVINDNISLFVPCSVPTLMSSTKFKTLCRCLPCLLNMHVVE